MTFKDWAKRSELFCRIASQEYMHTRELSRVTEAAYNAGKRHGRKETEDIAVRAIALREMLK